LNVSLGSWRRQRNVLEWHAMLLHVSKMLPLFFQGPLSPLSVAYSSSHVAPARQRSRRRRGVDVEVKQVVVGRRRARRRQRRAHSGGGRHLSAEQRRREPGSEPCISLSTSGAGTGTGTSTGTGAGTGTGSSGRGTAGGSGLGAAAFGLGLGRVVRRRPALGLRGVVRRGAATLGLGRVVRRRDTGTSSSGGQQRPGLGPCWPLRRASSSPCCTVCAESRSSARGPSP